MNSPNDSSLFERIYAALPQTQCTRCSYPDCAAYAQAIACGHAAINQCPPGGAEGVQRLSRITGLPAQALNPAHGAEGPRALAIIDEAWCIGCTLCIKACPTDAILGSHKLMHTVIEPYCTGCELCVPVCPVDCISLENVTGTRTGWSAWSQPQADTARSRYEARNLRHPHQKDKPVQTPDDSGNGGQAMEMAAPELPAQPLAMNAVAERKRAMIEAVLARARAQREKKA
ncbi:MAG: electron transport complex subunit RsxB [Pseudomonadota bacterium]|nr:electron transport complex subunit RsxB [Pseudomonadota bacterium]